MANDDGRRQLLLLVVATILVGLGAELRLAAPLATGAVVIAFLSVRVVGPELATLPHWILWAAAGSILLTLGATWEARLDDARRFSGLVRPRIEALR